MKMDQRKSRRYRLTRIHQSYNTILLLCLFLLPLYLAACGGKLGAIHSEDVGTLLSQADDALTAAREVNAPSLAFEAYEQAETEFDKAKDALSNKKGVDAIKYANNAIAYAKIAKRVAIQNTKDAESNANILSKDAQIGELRKQLIAEDKKISNLEVINETLRDSESGLQNTIRNLESEKQELLNERTIHNQKVSALNESLKVLQARVSKYELDMNNYGSDLKNLSRKVDAAESIAKTESRQKRAAIAEAESLRRQMREQAKIFTDKLAAANKRNVVVEHVEYVKRQEEKARAFAAGLPSKKTPRTRRTSLSTGQINAGKTELSNWDKTWKSKNMDAHFAFYTPNVTATQIVIRESKENATTLNKTQLETKLREMNKLEWTKTEEFTEVEQESVIGTYRFSRLVAPAETEDDTALFELWIREVWAHQIQGKWKIYRETLQVYENIPKL